MSLSLEMDLIDLSERGWRDFAAASLFDTAAACFRVHRRPSPPNRLHPILSDHRGG